MSPLLPSSPSSSQMKPKRVKTRTSTTSTAKKHAESSDATAKPKKVAIGRWTDEEHRLFLEGLETFPYRAWKKIATLIETRTVVQIRTHAQKYYQKLDKAEAMNLARNTSSTKVSGEVSRDIARQITAAEELRRKNRLQKTAERNAKRRHQNLSKSENPRTSKRQAKQVVAKRRSLRETRTKRGSYNDENFFSNLLDEESTDEPQKPSILTTPTREEPVTSEQRTQALGLNKFLTNSLGNTEVDKLPVLPSLQLLDQNDDLELPIECPTSVEDTAFLRLSPMVRDVEDFSDDESFQWFSESSTKSVDVTKDEPEDETLTGEQFVTQELLVPEDSRAEDACGLSEGDHARIGDSIFPPVLDPELFVSNFFTVKAEKEVVA